VQLYTVRIKAQQHPFTLTSSHLNPRTSAKSKELIESKLVFEHG
jgi:hypothetical protein